MERIWARLEPGLVKKHPTGMRIFFMIFGVVLFARFGVAEEKANDLSQHLWSERVLVLAAHDPDDPAMQTMVKRLKESAEGVKERNLVVYRVRTDDALARKWKLSAPFSLILIGKDGTEKFRSNKPVEVEMIFRTIDAMPMRMREIRESQDTAD